MIRFLSALRRSKPDIAVDFGTSNLRLVSRDGRIIFDEPSLCCFSRQDGVTKFVAAGAAVRAMLDRTPRGLTIKHPLCRGVLQDIEAAKELLRFALSQTRSARSVRSPSALIGIPADATQAERSAMLTAANDAGFGAVELISEPLAAAIGAGIDVEAPRGALLVECGAATTEVSVFALGGSCAAGSVRVGSTTLDQAIADYLHLEHKFLIGHNTAEEMKLDYAGRQQSSSCSSSVSITAKGRCLRRGLPMTLEIPLSELDRIVDRHFEQIVRVVHDVLAQTPPELSQDIFDVGVILTGGGALVPRIADMIAQATQLRVSVAADATHCVAKGLHHLLQA